MVGMHSVFQILVSRGKLFICQSTFERSFCAAKASGAVNDDEGPGLWDNTKWDSIKSDIQILDAVYINPSSFRRSYTLFFPSTLSLSLLHTKLTLNHLQV